MSSGQLVTCNSNLVDIGRALETYATDNMKQFPDRLDMLTPRYLETIPTCRAAEKGHPYAYLHGKNPESFTVYCNGCYHSPLAIGRNLPQYTSHEGLDDGHRR